MRRRRSLPRRPPLPQLRLQRVVVPRRGDVVNLGFGHPSPKQYNTLVLLASLSPLFEIPFLLILVPYPRWECVSCVHES